MKLRAKHVAALSGTIAAGAALAFVAVRRSVSHRWPLPAALDGERRFYESQSAGRASYYFDDSGEGAPVVFVHSINAAASAYEMKPLFESFLGKRPVYAPDLPGFGFSDRSDRAYSPELYGSFLSEFLETIAAKHGPVDVVALSLSCEFAARAALKSPGAVRSLTMISPTGFSAKKNLNGVERARAKERSDTMHRFLSSSIVAQPLYDGLVSQASIRYFLGKSFVGPVHEGLCRYSYATSHQPEARNAPLHFLSGRLFDPNIRVDTYEALPMPVSVIYDKDANVRFDELEATLRRCKNWRSTRIAPTRGLPQFDKPEETVDAIDDFLRHVATLDSAAGKDHLRVTGQTSQGTPVAN